MNVRSAVGVCALVGILVSGPACAEVRWVPVVAQSPGSDGRYWNTEMWVSNLSDRVGSYAITFLPAGEDNSRLLEEETTAVPIGPGETHYLNNVVPPKSGGALRVVTTEAVVVRCRLFNVEGRGSVGQFVPALTSEELIGPRVEGVLVPLVRSSQFRTNVGFFNPGLDPITIRVQLVDADGHRAGGAEYTLEPGSQAQVNDLLLAFRVNRSDGHQLVMTATGPFAAYASLVDTRTGAPTLVVPAIR